MFRNVRHSRLRPSKPGITTATVLVYTVKQEKNQKHKTTGILQDRTKMRSTYETCQ